MAAENYLHSPLLLASERAAQTCSLRGAEGGLQAKDFTTYLIFINTYMIALIAIYVVFFTTDYKRSKVMSCSAQVH
jgi:hypothetical protein